MQVSEKRRLSREFFVSSPVTMLSSPLPCPQFPLPLFFHRGGWGAVRQLWNHCFISATLPVVILLLLILLFLALLFFLTAGLVEVGVYQDLPMAARVDNAAAHLLSATRG